MQVLPDRWDEIKAIAQDTAGNFWFGSTAGITYYNLQTNRFRHFAIDEDFALFQEMGNAPTCKHNRSAVRCEGKPLDE